MTSKEILDNFSKIDSKSLTAAKYINGQNPFQYEEEFGTDFIHFTDKMISDMLLEKKKYYRLFYLSKAITYYRQFYDYCMSCGYINYNPVSDNSIYFTYSYMLQKIVKLGNVELYSRNYITSKCNGFDENTPYYKSIALSIYEGVKDYNALSKIKYSDVDFKNGTIKVADDHIKISEELLQTYKDMYDMNSFKNMSRQEYFLFDDSIDSLIRQFQKRGEGKSSNDLVRFARFMSLKIVETGLDCNFIYDSGLIFRLSEILGKERLVEILEYDSGLSKKEKIDNNRVMQAALIKAGSNLLCKNFLFDYRVYGVCLKNNLIK